MEHIVNGSQADVLVYPAITRDVVRIEQSDCIGIGQVAGHGAEGTQHAMGHVIKERMAHRLQQQSGRQCRNCSRVADERGCAIGIQPNRHRVGTDQAVLDVVDLPGNLMTRHEPHA